MESSEGGLSQAAIAVSTALLGLRDAWVRRLIDFSRNNRLIYHRELKTGTLTLGKVTDEAIARLLSGVTCPVADFRAEELTTRERAKVREIRLRAKANEEERGLQTLFCALGFATWPSEDGGRPANAPMFLLPVNIINNLRTGELALKAAGDLSVNRVLLAKLDDELHVQIDIDDILADDTEPDFAISFQSFSQILTRIGKLNVDPDCVLSNFDFQKMAMVEDLRNNAELLAANDLVLAISGDEAARACIAETQRLIDHEELDKIPPADELFVLDADSSQQRVIHSFLRHPSHGAIKGPPGTGKSQTIANLIAALVGSGLRVLFVAEKRAALEVVQKRLAQVGLGHLVLDLHGGDVKRKTIYERLRASDASARTSPPANGQQLDDRVSKLRERLNRYAASVNMVRTACGQSAYDLFAALTRLKDVTARTRWRGKAIEQFTPDRYREARELVMELSDNPALLLRKPGVPWSSADIKTNEEAAEAIAEIEGLQNSIQEFHDECGPLFLRDYSLAPTTVSGLPIAENYLRTLNACGAAFDRDIFDEDAGSLSSVLEPATRGILRHFFALMGAHYRSAWRRARKHRVDNKKRPNEVQRLLAELACLPAEWRSRSLADALSATRVSRFETTSNSVITATTHLSGVLGHDLSDDILALSEELAALEAASRNAYLVASVRTKENRLREVGAAPLVREFGIDSAEPDKWVRIFEKAWFQSHLDHLFATDPVLSTFKGYSHSTLVKDFKRADHARLAESALRIRRAAAERYINALNANPSQRATVNIELNKKTKHKSFRNLISSAPDVVSAIAPCIMASPLSVSQLLPSRVLFDVVIFDEASQVLPEDAIPTIIRGKHTVVAGDQKQLPPTTFFALTDREEEDEESDLAASGMESILGLMSGFVEPRPLEWHYRSRDEALIAFSNHYIYNDRLLTFPGIGGRQSAVRHEYVRPTLADDQELSCSAEVKRVVELILQHAEIHPNESLGVIAMGIKHARRIDETLQAERLSRPELDEFFAENRTESFFVKNLERVQGDERDAIILSVGYGPDRSGKMVYRFGPILLDGGERRLNVAVTRAKNRVTVVSSFKHVDLDPQRLRSAGAKLLGRYIQYAESGGTNLGREGAVEDAEINDFEADIAEALANEGFDLIPQYGVSSYRIDFAVRHPHEPGRFVLAVECDGATYHGSPTARDRDRLRQQHLEALGWRFHRIWSTDWFYNRSEEIERAKAAYAAALADVPRPSTRNARDNAKNRQPPETTPKRTPRPRIRRYGAISDYSDGELQSIIEWISSDGILRTDEEIIAEATREMGFERRGYRIIEALEGALRKMRMGSERRH